MKKRNDTRSTCNQLSELRKHKSSITTFDTSLYSLKPTNSVRIQYTKLPVNLSIHKITTPAVWEFPKFTMHPAIKKEPDEEREEHNQEMPQGQQKFDQTHFELDKGTQNPSRMEKKTKRASKKSNGTKQIATTRVQNNENKTPRMMCH